jgi:hypothetical protein
MKRLITIATLLLLFTGVQEAYGQNPAPEIPADKRVQKLPRQHMNGPRFGVTVFTGETLAQRELLGYGAMMSQIGWQFETQIVSLESGNTALIEWLALLGGIENGEYNLTGSMILGFRLDNGLEFGMGPALSYNAEHHIHTSSIQFAGGASIPLGDMYIPVNLGVGISKGEARLTMLTGWIVG